MLYSGITFTNNLALTPVKVNLSCDVYFTNSQCYLILGQFQNLTPKGEMNNISKQRETPASTRLTRVIITYNHGGITPPPTW